MTMMPALSRRMTVRLAVAAILIPAVVVLARPRLRQHTAEAARPLRLVQADRQPPDESVVSLVVDSDGEPGDGHGHRHVEANAIPKHAVGAFPNRGNPNSIRAQRFRFRLPLDPQEAAKVTPLIPPPGQGRPLHPFGVAVNGVPLEPGAGEFWRGNPRLGWTYEPLGGAIPMGLDENHAHVQPTGKYHYHGLPTGLLDRLGVNASGHSPRIGWAADGFPIYAQYGYADPEDAESEIIELRTSYRLKEGERPGGANAPGGTHDGAFVQDYEYKAGLGDLDECNGRRGVSPEFPEGTYAYFLTSEWPVIPRAFRGKPANLR